MIYQPTKAECPNRVGSGKRQDKQPVPGSWSMQMSEKASEQWKKQASRKQWEERRKPVSIFLNTLICSNKWFCTFSFDLLIIPTIFEPGEGYLTIIPRAQIGSASIATRDHESERNNFFFSKIQLVGEKHRDKSEKHCESSQVFHRIFHRFFHRVKTHRVLHRF